MDEVIKLADMYLDARIYRDKPVYKKFKDVPNQKTFTWKVPEDKHTQSKTEANSDKTQRVCYLCQQPRHIRKNCYLNKRVSRGSAYVVAVCSDTSDCDHDLSTPGTVQLQCGCRLPLVGCLSVGAVGRCADARLATTSGLVNGRNLSVLRDTGCTTAVIRRELVTDEQQTGTFKCYRVPEGSMGRAETAVVDVESPIFTGRLECLCISSPVCDLIIGNVPGVKTRGDVETVAVSTRAQVAAANIPKAPLRVPMLQDLQISSSDLQRMQSEGEDLKKFF